MNRYDNLSPKLVVPEDADMAEEPATTIGELFADKQMVKTLVTALVGLVSIVFRVSTDDATIENVTTVVTFGAIIVTGFFAQYEKRQFSRGQARATRSAVYSPKAVEVLVDAARAR